MLRQSLLAALIGVKDRPAWLTHVAQHQALHSLEMACACQKYDHTQSLQAVCAARMCTLWAVQAGKQAMGPECRFALDKQAQPDEVLLNSESACQEHERGARLTWQQTITSTGSSQRSALAGWADSFVTETACNMLCSLPTTTPTRRAEVMGPLLAIHPKNCQTVTQSRGHVCNAQLPWAHICLPAAASALAAPLRHTQCCA